MNLDVGAPSFARTQATKHGKLIKLDYSTILAIELATLIDVKIELPLNSKRYFVLSINNNLQRTILLSRKQGSRTAPSADVPLFWCGA